MYVLNPEKIEHKIGFKKNISDYLQSHGVPLLATEGDIYYFADTDKLREALKSAPLWVKLMNCFV
jgi:hypothetical protein